MSRKKAIAGELMSKNVDAQASAVDASNACLFTRSTKARDNGIKGKMKDIGTSMNNEAMTAGESVGEKIVTERKAKRLVIQKETVVTARAACLTKSRKQKKVGFLKKHVGKSGSVANKANIEERVPVKGEKCGAEDVHINARAYTGMFHAVKEPWEKKSGYAQSRQVIFVEPKVGENKTSVTHGKRTRTEDRLRRDKECRTKKAKLTKEQVEATRGKTEGRFEETVSKRTLDSGSANKTVTVKRRKRRRSIETKGTISISDDGLKEISMLCVVRKKKKTLEGIENGKSFISNPVAEKVKKAARGSKKMIGAHVSAAGGLENAVYNAVEIGCRAFALFLRNQRTWKTKPLDDDSVKRFKAAIEVVPHGSYLVNAGSADEELLKKSRKVMLDECERCERLGILLYNIHPGSTVGKHSIEDCIDTVAASINYVLERTASIVIVIETMAGQGSTVGGSFEEIRSIIDRVEEKDRIGVCMDTCHIFAAGYDIRTEEAYRKVMDDFERIVGFRYLKAVHLNDSKGGLGSKLDRHENIGKGQLRCAFKYFMCDARFDGIPMVLETPEGDYAAEMVMKWKNSDYQERSRKNNSAVRRSQEARRTKETLNRNRIVRLEEENSGLCLQIDVLKGQLNHMQLMLMASKAATASYKDFDE